MGWMQNTTKHTTSHSSHEVKLHIPDGRETPGCGTLAIFALGFFFAYQSLSKGMEAIPEFKWAKNPRAEHHSATYVDFMLECNTASA